ncbi:MAG: hypothetical protein K2X93_10980 [Candidatus Obscuribacterales bacterium]|nr:hypothetical protein [Candidatus Obscuribacterales bacterium]
MLLHTIGSLVVVCGVSYLLVSASWQVVLLSFVVAGVGYATWKIRKALVRRAKIKALWRRSIEIDAMLGALPKAPIARAETVATESRQTRKPSFAMDRPVEHVDPSSRIYRFSMKRLAEAREQNIAQQVLATNSV